MALLPAAVLTAAELALQVYSEPKDYLVHNEASATFIAIEGSDELADWRRNFEFVLTSSDEHLGFGTYARELMAQMWADGVRLNPDTPLVICGHSLGGAVATIVAAQLQGHLPRIELVTFGSPRPGGARLAKRLKVPHTRFVHADDVVPHLPSSLLGFRHTAKAQQLQPFELGHVLHGVKDHDMAVYRALVHQRASRWLDPQAGAEEQ